MTILSGLDSDGAQALFRALPINQVSTGKSSLVATKFNLPGHEMTKIIPELSNRLRFFRRDSCHQVFSQVYRTGSFGTEVKCVHLYVT